jgi:hypothetical protein
LINDTYRNTTLTNNIGDKVTGIVAQVNRINDSPQLYPYNDFTVVSRGNAVTPPVITLADVPDYTYQLVQINDLTFTEANGTKTFGPNSPYLISDASVTSTTTTFRTPANMPNPDYINTVIPAKRNVIVLIAKNSSAVTTHYLFARSAAELDVQLSGITDLKQNRLSISDGKIHFETLGSENVKIYSVSGQMVKNFVSVAGKNSVELTKGVYVIRIGGKTAKVVL